MSLESCVAKEPRRFSKVEKMSFESCVAKELLASGEITGKSGDISYQIVTLQNVDKLVDFFFNSYFKDEPCLKELGVKPDNPKVRAYLQQMICPHGNTGCALMAVDVKNNYKVVGYLIGYTHLKADLAPQSSLQQMCQQFPETWGHVLPMMDSILNYSDIYQMYPDIEKLQSLFGHGTDENYQGMGIGTNLVVRSINQGRSVGVQVIQCIASSLCTRRVLERLGFTELKECVFDDHHKKEKKYLPADKELKPSWEAITTHALRIDSQ